MAAAVSGAPRDGGSIPLPDATIALARSQLGVVTRRQLLEAGATPDTLRWRAGRDWRLLLPGVYAQQTGPPSQHQRLVAAQLVGGDGSWLAGTTAAALRGLQACSLNVPIRVLVPAARRSRRIAWVDVRRTTLLGEPVVERGPLRVGCLARAVVDAAAETPDERNARALVIEAVQRRLVRLDDLEHWVDAHGRRGSVRLRRILDEGAAGAWSVPESDLLALVRTSRSLPPALAKPVLTGPAGEALTSPDVWFDDVGMAVLVQSRRFHADALDWDATVEQGSDLSAVRVVVVGITPERSRETPARRCAASSAPTRMPSAAATAHRSLPPHATRSPSTEQADRTVG